MTEETIPQVKLEQLCANPLFKVNEQNIRFGITDFGNRSSGKSGFYIQKDQETTSICLQDLDIYHELHLQKASMNVLQSMQIQQNPTQPTEFNLLIAAISGCCDGGILGGTYSLEDNSFDILFAKRVPFNTCGIIGYLPFSKEEHYSRGHIIATGSGCDGAGIQYLCATERSVDQEFIYNLQKSELDPRIGDHKPSYESFQYQDSIKITNDALTIAGLNIEEAFKISEQYYKYKEQFETEQNKDKKKSYGYTIERIWGALAKIRLAVSQSRFITRNRNEVYP